MSSGLKLGKVAKNVVPKQQARQIPGKGVEDTAKSAAARRHSEVHLCHRVGTKCAEPLPLQVAILIYLTYKS